MSSHYKMSPALARIIELEVTVVSAKTPICPFLLGEPGIGKSSIVRDMCERNGWLFHELLCNQLGDRTDLTGCRSVKEEEVWKQIFFPHKSIQDAITDATENPDQIVVLFLDEINRTSSDITSSVLSFITARTIGTYTFPENIRFIVAGNDKGNINALDTASISRFAMFNLDPDAATWLSYSKGVDTVSPYIEKVLNEHPELIVCKEINTVTSTVQTDDGDDYENEYAAFNDAPEGFSQFTTPRTLSGLNALLCAMTPDEFRAYNGVMTKDADTNEDMTMLQALVYSHIGHTSFAQYLVENIANDLIAGNVKKAAASSKPPVQPQSYAKLMRCSDRDTRNEMLSSLGADGLAELLVYMLFDKSHDNSDLINAACSVYPDDCLPMNHLIKLTSLYNDELLDENNTNAFKTNGSVLSCMLNTALFNA